MTEKKPPEKQMERAREAAENLEKIQKKIAPYTKPRQIARVSTAGKWASSVPANINMAHMESFTLRPQIRRQDRFREGASSES